MTRNDFPAAAARTINELTGLPVKPENVSDIVLSLWDFAQDSAADEEQFRSLLVTGLATLTRDLADLRAAYK